MKKKNGSGQSTKIVLDSATHMFIRNARLSLLDKIDTSNVTDFGAMFVFADAVTSIPKFNTSKGVNFEGMFNSASSIKEIPEMDFSEGVNFDQTFRCNLGVVRIPPLNTVKGTNFNCMFYDCHGLQIIEKINISNATNLWDMFGNCTSLEEVNFEGCIPITLRFQSSEKLSLKTAKGALIALTDYSGTDKEFTESIYFNAKTWELLNADGETSPTGTTWEQYVDSKGWSI